MSDFRRATRDLLHAAMTVEDAALEPWAAAHLADGAVVHVSAPVDRLEGRDAILAGLIRPLRAALGHARRRDAIFVGGDNRFDDAFAPGAGGGRFCASVTHYAGRFAAPLFGLAPSGRLAFLRAGEFWRVGGDGRIERGHVILDLMDLARQAGRMPLPAMLGQEMTWPAPATLDGVLPASEGGAESADVVDRMVAGLHAYDPETFESADQTGPAGVWHPDMMWYGPGGVGSCYRWEGFVAHHRAAFLRAFPDRKGGDHYCRLGDGPFAAMSGWPSMTMTHRGDYLGQPADGRALTLRVMDFYRTQDARLIENWVCLDYVDLFRQMGRDLVTEANAVG